MISKISTYKLLSLLLESEQKLSEGLIKTHDISESVDILNNFFDLQNDRTIDIKNNKIHLKFETITLDEFFKLFLLINNLGYEISKITMFNYRDMPKQIDTNVFKNDYLIEDNLKNIKYLSFDLEPKYDIVYQIDFSKKETEKTNILYHVTETRFVDRILKNGLIPRSKNTKSNHPERIYLSLNLNVAKEYILEKSKWYTFNPDKSNISKKSKFDKIEFSIFEITIDEKDDIIFYKDPNYIDKGIYTYDNISNKSIKLLK